jgi:HK97 family phage portal protein
MFSETRYFGAVDTTPRPAPDDDFWYGNDQDARTSSGVMVDPNTAMCVAAVFACVRVISESIASLDWRYWQRLQPKGRNEVTDGDIFNLLSVQPNAWQTPYEYKEMKVGHLCLRGNAYSRIIGDGRGGIDSLLPLHPDRMCVHKLDNNTLGYEYVDEKGRRSQYNQDEIFHVRGMSDDGVKGIDPIAYARNIIGISIAAEQHGASYYKNGGRPGGVVEHPGIMNEIAFNNFRRSWNAVHAGPRNAGKVAILEQGMKYHELGISNVNLQYIESRKFQRQEIASIFRVPLHMIGDLEFATYSNIEQQSLDFYKSILPWTVKICQAFDRDCVMDRKRNYTEFDPRKLLLGDVLTRYRAHQMALGSGWKNIDEVRDEEGMNPLPDGNGQEYRVAVNTVPIGGDNTNETDTQTSDGSRMGNRFAQNGANYSGNGST